MKQKHFYSHLIEMDSLYIELDELNLSESERHGLASLIDANLHSTILNAILSEMAEEDKLKFLDHLRNHDDDKIWTHLNAKVNLIEEKIKKAAGELKDQMHEDLKEARRKNN
jgi:hypothetical protein